MVLCIWRNKTGGDLGGKMKAKDYLGLPYHIVIRHIDDESGSYYFATVQEFDGCMSHGDTYAEAFENIQEAMEGWIETKLENGLSVPKPVDESQYSGKFVLRVPKTLHALLVMEAEKEGVSLNQYALYRLSM
jgi:predicted RNase H-like HicB family nuclease